MQEIKIEFFAWFTGNWLRLSIIALFVILVLEIVIKKLISTIKFRSKINKLPGPEALNPLLGNIPLKVLSLFTNNNVKQADEFYTSQVQSLLGHTFIYKTEPFYRLWIGQEPVICVWKPEIVELVLGDNFLLEKSYHYDFIRPWLGNGLLTSPGRIWRPRRKLLVPSFHFNILEAFIGVFDRKSRFLTRNIKRKLNESFDLDKLETNNRSTVVDIVPIITACTLDAICETIMGVSIDAQDNPDNDYCQSIYVVGETFLERIIQPRYWIDVVFRYTELGKLYSYHLNKLHTFTRTVIRLKKKILNMPSEKAGQSSSSNSSLYCLGNKLTVLEESTVDNYQTSKKDVPKLPKAFLDLLLDKMNLPGSLKLSDEDIREEVDTFMFEGHDTTAMALSWTLFLLGHNPEAQTKLQKEVDDFFLNDLISPDDEFELEKIKKMKYLDCVIKEALRLCPSVPFIGRKTTKDLKLGDYIIPPGCVVFVLIYQLHRNAEIFPNPEQFDPDRFLPSNSLRRHPFAYVPFSAGPRNCIGQKFAMAEMKTILAHLLRNFNFESITPLDKARVQMEMVLRPKCPLNLRISSRR